MPWVIFSQMVPILAIAPIVIVVFGAIGIRGLFPKSIISAYLCFFPVTIGMVKGLTSPDAIQLDLMRTWSANKLQVFWKLRWPSSIPFLFTSLKVSVTISLVGAIVAELPTGAQAGIGARLLTGSYYGQTVQIWAALFAAAIMATVLIAIIDAAGSVDSAADGSRGVIAARPGARILARRARPRRGVGVAALLLRRHPAWRARPVLLAAVVATAAPVRTGSASVGRFRRALASWRRRLAAR